MKAPVLPPLANYTTLQTYIPGHGDYIIWARWFTTWHGLVTDFNQITGELSVVFAGIPILLFTMEESEQKRETRKLKLGDIINASKGTFAILKHDLANNANIWYI